VVLAVVLSMLALACSGPATTMPADPPAATSTTTSNTSSNTSPTSSPTPTTDPIAHQRLVEEFANAGYSTTDIDSSRWSVAVTSCSRTQDVAGHQLPVGECSYSDSTGTYSVVGQVLTVDAGPALAWCVASCKPTDTKLPPPPRTCSSPKLPYAGPVRVVYTLTPWSDAPACAEAVDPLVNTTIEAVVQEGDVDQLSLDSATCTWTVDAVIDVAPVLADGTRCPAKAAVEVVVGGAS
jgi:hypothetical protein